MIFLKNLSLNLEENQKFSHWAFNVIFFTKMKSGVGGCETLPTPCESFMFQTKSYAIEHIQTVMTITEHNAVPVSLVLNAVFGVALVCKKGDNVHDILFAQQDNCVGLVRSHSALLWLMFKLNNLKTTLSFGNTNTIHQFWEIASQEGDFLNIFQIVSDEPCIDIQCHLVILAY